MFGQAPGVDQDVIDVDQDRSIEKILEHIKPEVLEYGGELTRPQGKMEYLKWPVGCLQLVPLTYPDEVIIAVEVQLSEDPRTWNCSRAAGTSGREYLNFLNCNLV